MVGRNADDAIEMDAAAVKVLVVDDQPAFRALAGIWLRDGLGERVELLEADSLAAMREVIARERPEVVLLDQRLPDGEGLQAAREVLAEDPDVAVLLLTGMCDPALDAEAERLGVTDFLVKQEVDGPLLSRAVRYAVRRTRDLHRLRSSEARYRSLVQALPDAGVTVVDERLRFVMTGGHALEAAGWDPDAVVGTDVAELLAKHGQPELVEHYRAALEGEERTIQHASPHGRTYLMHFAPLPASGGPREAMAVVLDITDQLRQAADLERAQAIGQTGSWSWDVARGDVRCSPELFRIFGLDPDTPPTFDLFLGVVPAEDAREQIRSRVHGAILAPGSVEHEFPARRADGTLSVMSSRFRSVAGSSGEVVRLEGIVQDVTERRAAKAERDLALRRSEDDRLLLQATLDQLPAHVVLKDLDGRLEFVNRAYAEFMGLPAGELVGRTERELVGPGTFDQSADAERRVVETREPVTFEERRVVGDRHAVLSQVSFPIFDALGEVSSVGAMTWDMTEVREAAEALHASREHYRLVLASLPKTVVAAHDRDLRLLSIEGGLLGALTERGAELVGKQVHEYTEASALEVVEPALRRGLAGEEVELSLTLVEGGAQMELAVSPYRDADGEIVGVVGVARDVTSELAARRAHEAAERRFQVAFDRAPIGMCLSTPDGRLLRVNEAWTALTGYADADARRLAALGFVHVEDTELVRTALSGLGEGPVTFEHRIAHTDGHTVWVQVRATLLRDADGAEPNVLAQVQDVTERRRYEDRLEHLADHDPLTGLLNRRGFGKSLEDHLGRNRRYGVTGALLVIDLDGFKYINDTLGHSAGDKLIVDCAEALRHRLRESDVLARFGGDEFAVLLPTSDAAQAEHVAHDLVCAVREQATGFGGQSAGNVTASIGVAPFTEPQATAEEMLVNADLAMYDAKESGKDRLAVFESESHVEPRIKAHMSWLQRIDRALEADRFVLFAQPIVDLARGEVVRHEVLLRMLDEQGGLIPPGAFLHVAERFGVVKAIDKWVVRNAIAAMAEVRAGGGRLPLSVNVSGLTAGDPELVELIAHDLSDSGVAPGDLVVELTETAAVADIARARSFAEALRGMGCAFALDDFGAGYGSFYYLKHLPFDVLKIDGEFVRHATTNATDRLVISAVTEIARGLGKDTVAEFVPDDETIALLLRHGVDLGQGHHLGRPQPLRVLLDSLAGQNPATAA